MSSAKISELLGGHIKTPNEYGDIGACCNACHAQLASKHIFDKETEGEPRVLDKFCWNCGKNVEEEVCVVEVDG